MLDCPRPESVNQTMVVSTDDTQVPGTVIDATRHGLDMVDLYDSQPSTRVSPLALHVFGRSAAVHLA